jgi:hypothetical protein
MPVDDRTRLNLHRKLDTVRGPEEADTLMAHLPPVTWDRVATKDDVAASEIALRNDLHSVATQLRSEMHGLRHELRADFVEGTNRQITWLVTFAAAWSSLLVTIVGFMS